MRGNRGRQAAAEAVRSAVERFKATGRAEERTVMLKAWAVYKMCGGRRRWKIIDYELRAGKAEPPPDCSIARMNLRHTLRAIRQRTKRRWPVVSADEDHGDAWIDCGAEGDDRGPAEAVLQDEQFTRYCAAFNCTATIERRPYQKDWKRAFQIRITYPPE